MRQKQTENEIVGNVVRKLSWQMATRNDQRVARAIYKGETIWHFPSLVSGDNGFIRG